MSGKYQKLNWQEEINGHAIDCSLDIAIHPADSNIIFLTIPGVDGSVDGYENKYVRIAENIQEKYGVAVVRMSNPYISSFFWESNIRRTLEFIENNTKTIINNEDFELHIMAHSAGAAIVAQIAWEYPGIKKLLLVNTAFKMNPDKILNELDKFTGIVRFVYGTKDPSIDWAKILKEKYEVAVIDGADHNFSGENIETFIKLPTI